MTEVVRSGAVIPRMVEIALSCGASLSDKLRVYAPSSKVFPECRKGVFGMPEVAVDHLYRVPVVPLVS